MFQVFRWRGEPIQDIHAWAAARGERMVHYRQWRREWLFGREVIDEHFGEMPESFWLHLHISNGWHYELLDA